MFKGSDLVKDLYLVLFNKFSLSSLVFYLGLALVKCLIQFKFKDKYILYPPKDNEDK